MNIYIYLKPSILMNLAKDFNSIVDVLTERLRKLAEEKEIVNLSEEFNNATLDAIAKVIGIIIYKNFLNQIL
jgi:hypothetical protein